MYCNYIVFHIYTYTVILFFLCENVLHDVCGYVGACIQSLHPIQLFMAPWTVASKFLLSMGFSRKEYWSGLPFPPPRCLPDPGIEPTSPCVSWIAGRFFTCWAIREPLPTWHTNVNMYLITTQKYQSKCLRYFKGIFVVIFFKLNYPILVHQLLLVKILIIERL